MPQLMLAGKRRPHRAQLTGGCTSAILARNHLRWTVFYKAGPAGAWKEFWVIDSVEEEGLVEQAKTDPEAFGLLYERYVGRIYSYVYYRIGSHHDAEDLTARVFFQAMRHIRGYVHRGVPFSSWLYRIAHNAVANWYRDRSRRKAVSLDRLAVMRLQADDSLFDRAAEGEQRQALLAAVRRLPADRQELLILKFVERLPNSEIGQIMGRSEGAVKSLYHRTLSALRQELEELKET